MVPAGSVPMPITSEDYAELRPEIGPQLDDIIFDAQHAVDSLLRPLGLLEKMAMARTKPERWAHGIRVAQGVYDPLHDITLETAGLPAWDALPPEAQRKVAYRIGTHPDEVIRVIARAALILQRQGET